MISRAVTCVREDSKEHMSVGARERGMKNYMRHSSFTTLVLQVLGPEIISKKYIPASSKTIGLSLH
jgi:hypothetical protein